MSTGYTLLLGSAQLAYAEALEVALTLDQPVDRAGLSFISRQVKGSTYWYLRQRVGARSKDYYLGPESETLLESIRRQTQRWTEGRVEGEVIERLVASALAAGCMGIDHRAYRVLTAVAQAGLFRSGGVLVGSYAFVALGNMLGVSWRPDTTLTQDLDLAVNTATIALPGPPIDKVILDAEQGLIAVPMLPASEPSTSFKIRGGQFRVDLLTPLHGRPVSSSYVAPVGAHATALRYLDYLLEDAQKALLLHGTGVLVNVPTPARYALHKLVISQRRAPTEALKSRKDVLQAGLVLNCLRDQRPGDIWLALDAAIAYGGKFLTLLRQGVALLPPGETRDVITDYALKHTTST